MGKVSRNRGRYHEHVSCRTFHDDDRSVSTFTVVLLVCLLWSHQMALLHGSGDLSQLKQEALLLVSAHPLHPAGGRRSTLTALRTNPNITLRLMQ